MALLSLKHLTSEERAEVDQAVAGARASFEALDPPTKEKLLELGPPPLPPDSDLALYSVLEDDGRTSEQKDVVAPLNDELTPGSEVAFEGRVSTLFRIGPPDQEDVSLHVAERIVKADWEAFWNR